MRRTISIAFSFSGLALSLALFLLLEGCGNASEEQLAVPESGLSEEQPDTSRQKDIAAFEKHVEERNSKADTQAIDHARLAAMLPEKIAGYQAEIDKASTFETKRFTFSEATRVFYSEKEDYVEFIAGDYVNDPDFFKVNLQRYNLAQDVDIDGVRERKENAAELRPPWATDFFVWSLYNEYRGLYRLYLGLDYRYFVTIEVTGVARSPELKEYGGMLDWGKLKANPAR